ncbi:MAG: beta-Ala-His dipeptidase, partial [Oscillospiraceae bacterium]|nr:beta-Ala-His dipeptidase [Oscillospiraceae bacterium]
MIENLKPREVFDAFQKLCEIPHGSHNTDKISRFLEKYALDRGLFCRRDGAGNVIIVKEASPGYENAPTVIIQGHMDMVCVCDEGVDIDFSRDGLRLKTDGDFLYAEGTSLGGDDGIAVAYMMALLDYDGAHPRLEMLITTDEEVGMLGAADADLSALQGRRLINIDTDEQGVFIVGCAGGAEADCEFDLPVSRVEGKKLTVRLSDMHGGHSGTEIHRGYTNAIKLLGDKLRELHGVAEYRLISFSGGEKSNAIPSSGTVELVCRGAAIEKITAWCAALQDECKSAVGDDDKNLRVKCEFSDFAGDALDRGATEKFLDIIAAFPDGVQKWSRDFDGMVETSLNFGLCSLRGGKVSTTFLVRSLIDLETSRLMEKLEKIASGFGGRARSHGAYPAWEYEKDSPLCELMAGVYREMAGRSPDVRVVHAGLECGVLKKKLPGLECVSVGPDMFDIHTPRERLSISSAAFMWEYLCELLKRCK